MNPLEHILESPWRWSILAGLAFVAAVFGGIFMLALVWPHTVVRLWLYATLLATLFCLVKAVLERKADVDRAAERGPTAARPAPETQEPQV